MKIYTIIGGVNGVGKSSLTGVLASESNDLGDFSFTVYLLKMIHYYF